MNEQIDWSKAPRGTTGAMRANFDSTHRGGKTWKGKIEWLPIDGDFKDYAQGSDAWEYFAKPATPTWSGPEDGLPPVGLEFEWRYGDHAWKKGEALYIGTIYAVLKSTEGGEQHYYLRDMQFRPIRTAEQLAAEEREQGINEMVESKIAGGLAPWVCGELYDAGYRKVERP
jgi:hypothetical protein